MRTALVRGPEPRIAEIAAALGREGFDVIQSPLGEPRPPLSAGSVHCYVGMTAKPRPGSVEAVRSVLATIDDLTSVTPFFCPDATALLVMNTPDGDRGLDAATRLLGSTAVADQGAVRLAIRREPCSPTDIASALKASAISLADLAPDSDYATWRHEILSVAGEREVTYFGWIDHDSHAVVGVLRGGVLSPLQSVLIDDAVSWGERCDGRGTLAASMLRDLLGADAHCPFCAGSGRSCGRCRGTGLSEPVLDLADLLAKEIISSLPPEGFELRASSVNSWVDQIRRSL